MLNDVVIMGNAGRCVAFVRFLVLYETIPHARRFRLDTPDAQRLRARNQPCEL